MKCTVHTYDYILIVTPIIYCWLPKWLFLYMWSHMQGVYTGIGVAASCHDGVGAVNKQVIQDVSQHPLPLLWSTQSRENTESPSTRLQAGKSPGPNGIPIWLISSKSKKLFSPGGFLIYHSFSGRVKPYRRNFKDANFIHLFSNKGDTDYFCNKRREISLLSSACKILVKNSLRQRITQRLLDEYISRASMWL